MALIGEDEIYGFLDKMERDIGRATDARYGDLSIDNSISSKNARYQDLSMDGSISSKNARAEVSDISDQLPNVADIDVEQSETSDRTQSWCERSLDQLEMTVQLLDQCLDSDFKDLKRQQGIIEMCKAQIDEIKKNLQ